MWGLGPVEAGSAPWQHGSPSSASFLSAMLCPYVESSGFFLARLWHRFSSLLRDCKARQLEMSLDASSSHLKLARPAPLNVLACYIGRLPNQSSKQAASLASLCLYTSMYVTYERYTESEVIRTFGGGKAEGPAKPECQIVACRHAHSPRSHGDCSKPSSAIGDCSRRS